MPDRTVESRRHTPEQRKILRAIRKVAARIAAHKGDFDVRNALYVEGRRAGLIYAEMAGESGTSEEAIIQAVKKFETASGETVDSPKVRRKSVN